MRVEGVVCGVWGVGFRVQGEQNLKGARRKEGVEHVDTRAELDQECVPGVQRLGRDEDDIAAQILQLVRHPPVEERLLVQGSGFRVQG